MGEGLKQMFHEVSPSSSSSSSSRRAADDDELGESSSFSGDSDVDDESNTSSSPPPPSSHVHGSPLHELSSLVSQLPIKRGLSKFYKGKSQSFSSFSDVRYVEDLAKKESPIIKRRMRPSRSYAGGLDESETKNNDNNIKPCFGSSSEGPSFNKALISNKATRGFCGSSISGTSSGNSYFTSGKPPPIPMHKNL